MAEWWVAIFANAKTHLFSRAIKTKLMANLEARGCEEYPVPDGKPKNWALHKIKKGGICLPGMRLADETWVDLEVDGLTLHMPAVDVGTYLSILEGLPMRLDFGREYWKLHGDHHCLCLLQKQRDALLKELKRVLPEANAIADVETREFNKRMREINEHPRIDIQQRRKERSIEEA